MRSFANSTGDCMPPLQAGRGHWKLVAVSLAAILSATTQANTASATSSAATERRLVGTMGRDLANRDQAIRWPAEFSPLHADLFAHNEGLINAPCSKVWQHIIEADKWPQWYPNSKDVHIRGGTRLADQTVFNWSTFGLDVESRVAEFVPNSRISWYGYTPGTPPAFYHAWHLTEAGRANCKVVSDEVGKGESAKRLRAVDQGLMHRGHDLWIAALKWVSENPQPSGPLPETIPESSRGTSETGSSGSKEASVACLLCAR
jgi:uncharacterized protein YndB with AHSA1/START domain